jgi:hypothetical protein
MVKNDKTAPIASLYELKFDIAMITTFVLA